MEQGWGLGRLRALFAEQFEPKDTGYLYRRSSKGAPIVVSAEERDRYVAAYNRLLPWIFWGMIAAILILTIAAANYSQSGRALAEPVVAAGTLFLFALFAVAHTWIWSRASRELRGRGFARPAPSRMEVRRKIFARMSWTQLGLGFVLGAGLLLGFGEKHGWDPSGDWFGFGVAVLVVVAVAIQAAFKWWLERSA